MSISMVIEKSKDLLERDKEIRVGDFVTINNNTPLKVYIVKSITGSTATLYYIELTAVNDDVYIKELRVPFNNLLYLGDSYVNVGGILWNM